VKENELVQSLLWAGLLGLIGLAMTKVAERGAEAVWIKVFGTEPPRR
jgi:hypothetical protein